MTQLLTQHMEVGWLVTKASILELTKEHTWSRICDAANHRITTTIPPDRREEVKRKVACYLCATGTHSSTPMFESLSKEEKQLALSLHRGLYHYTYEELFLSTCKSIYTAGLEDIGWPDNRPSLNRSTMQDVRDSARLILPHIRKLTKVVRGNIFGFVPFSVFARLLHVFMLRNSAHKPGWWRRKSVCAEFSTLTNREDKVGDGAFVLRKTLAWYSNILNDDVIYGEDPDIFVRTANDAVKSFEQESTTETSDVSIKKITHENEASIRRRVTRLCGPSITGINVLHNERTRVFSLLNDVRKVVPSPGRKEFGSVSKSVHSGLQKSDQLMEKKDGRDVSAFYPLLFVSAGANVLTETVRAATIIKPYMKHPTFQRVHPDNGVIEVLRFLPFLSGFGEEICNQFPLSRMVDEVMNRLDDNYNLKFPGRKKKRAKYSK